MTEQQGQKLFSTITDLAFFATITIFGIHKIIGEVLIGTLLSSYAAYRFGVAQGKQQAVVALGNAMSGGGGPGGPGGGGGGGGFYARPSTGTSTPSMPAVRAPIVEQRTETVEYVEHGKTEKAPAAATTKPETPRAERPSVPGERPAVRGDATRRLAVAPIPAEALPSDPPPPSVSAIAIDIDTVATPATGPAATTGDPNQPIPEIEITESGPRRISTGVMNTLFNLASGR